MSKLNLPDEFRCHEKLAKQYHDRHMLEILTALSNARKRIDELEKRANRLFITNRNFKGLLGESLDWFADFRTRAIEALELKKP